MTVLLKRKMHCKSSQPQVFHTNHDCPHVLKSANIDNRFKEIAKEDAPPDSRECKYCQGKIPERNQDHQTNKKIKSDEFTPSDLDMTPMGER